MRLSVTDVLSLRPQLTRALALIDGPYSPWKTGAKYVDFQQPQPPAGVDLEVRPLLLTTHYLLLTTYYLLTAHYALRTTYVLLTADYVPTALLTTCL